MRVADYDSIAFGGYGARYRLFGHRGIENALAALVAVEVPYDKELPTIERLQHYAADHRLAIHGRHHEIYISDPRRTKPEKLKTVIRLPVEAQAG